MKKFIRINHESKNKSFFFFWPIIVEKIKENDTIVRLSKSILNCYLIDEYEKNLFRVEFDPELLLEKDLVLLEKHANFARFEKITIKGINKLIVAFHILEEEKDSYNNLLYSLYSLIDKKHKYIIAQYLYFLSSTLKIIEKDIYIIAGQILWKDPGLRKKLLEFFEIKEMMEDIELSNKLDLTKENYSAYIRKTSEIQIE
jgi:hypothetical protein